MKRQQTQKLAVGVITTVSALVIIPILFVLIFMVLLSYQKSI